MKTIPLLKIGLSYKTAEHTDNIITCSCGAIGKSKYINSKTHQKTLKHLNAGKICKNAWRILSSEERESYGSSIKHCRNCCEIVLPRLKHEPTGDWLCIKCDESVNIIYLCFNCNKYKLIESDDETE
jgi:hypothetical protein